MSGKPTKPPASHHQVMMAIDGWLVSERMSVRSICCWKDNYHKEMQKMTIKRRKNDNKEMKIAHKDTKSTTQKRNRDTETNTQRCTTTTKRSKNNQKKMQTVYKEMQRCLLIMFS